MIDAYAFGSMVTGGKRYTTDLIIFPDGSILYPWWRRSGHTLAMADIETVVAASPDILVVGTGQPGLLKPEPTLCRELETKGIETRVLPTREAVKEYNALCEQPERVAGCFHLTC